MAERPDMIELTGEVFDAPAEHFKALATVGDVRLYPKDNNSARWRREHGHMNEGFPGHCAASICWARGKSSTLYLSPAIDREALFFALRRESADAMERATKALASRDDWRATWDGEKKKYVLGTNAETSPE
ncbi:MAG: hypothetical protein R3F20_05505 [Planctomycetota bacterium]